LLVIKAGIVVCAFDLNTNTLKIKRSNILFVIAGLSYDPIYATQFKRVGWGRTNLLEIFVLRVFLGLFG
jgi:hypothetical protein